MDEDDAYYAYSYEDSYTNNELFMNNKLPTNNELPINNESPTNDELPTNDESSTNNESPTYDKPSKETPKKRKKQDNYSITWDYFMTEETENDYPDGMNTNSSIVKAMHIITKRRQEKLAQGLVEFIIKDCQLLNILCCQSFHQFLNNLKPGFRIPCKMTTKKLINQAYEWSHDQLFGIINIDGEFINLITDLWSSQTNKGYIEATAM
ncbi:17572_t:CDS:2 [Gigaspora margarita]|uniref:17572_t:CDS:1 n=1 Tax=Gigaspora margarita TaxID=4874 RepID=A0ABN7VIV9_GIGMA|nr:17572_t:CDS:2 [Gigaspora margarita]